MIHLPFHTYKSINPPRPLQNKFKKDLLQKKKNDPRGKDLDAIKVE